MKTLFVFAAIFGFINGFSVDSKGAFFTPLKKSLISIGGVVELIATIIVAITQRYWIGILIGIALFVVFYRVGYAIMRFFLHNPPQ